MQPVSALLELQRGYLVIARRVLLGHKLRQRSGRRLPARLLEKRTRVPLGHHGPLLVMRQCHTMQPGLDDTVRPALKGVAGVYDHLGLFARPRRCHGQELAGPGPVLELQPADAILEQQRDDAVVGVRPYSLRVALGQRLGCDLRVPVQGYLAGFLAAAVDKHAGRETHAHLDGGHELVSYFPAGQVMVGYRLSETRQVVFVGP